MTLTTLPLTTFEQSVHLKQIGFDWATPDSFNKDSNEYSIAGFQKNWNFESISNISRPTIPLALQFFREVKGLHIPIMCYPDANGRCYRTLWYFENDNVFDTHDQAASALLDHLIEMTS